MKVVINRCHGGFGLSDEAFALLLNLKGVKYEIKLAQVAIGVKEKEFYAAGHLGDGDYYLDQYDYCDNSQRGNPDLVAVVEQLGEGANGWAADLKIVEIPDDVKWHVAEYDGLEWIAENHRTWR
jgi:hypothetical protein